MQGNVIVLAVNADLGLIESINGSLEISAENVIALSLRTVTSITGVSVASVSLPALLLTCSVDISGPLPGGVSMPMLEPGVVMSTLRIQASHNGGVPTGLIDALTWLCAALLMASGVDYVRRWGAKARRISRIAHRDD